MNEFDDKGWSHVHHAASRGFIRSIEKFIGNDPELLELETTDSLHSTPFLLAVDSGSVDTVECFTGLGAKINVINTENHGAVEICALKGHIRLLEYFIKLASDKLPVWKKLIGFLESNSNEECLSAGKAIKALTEKINNNVNPSWEHLLNNKGIDSIVNVAKTSSSDEAKIPLMEILLNVIEKDDIRDKIAACGGIPVLVKNLKSPDDNLVELSARLLKELGTSIEYAHAEVHHNAIPELLKVIQTNSKNDALVEVLRTLENIAKSGDNHKATIGSTSGSTNSIVSLFAKDGGKPDKTLLIALTECISQLVDCSEQNQNAFVNESVTVHMLLLTRTKFRELQICAADTIHKLVQNNPYTQKVMVGLHAEASLMQLLKKTRNEIVLEKASLALWALAGSRYRHQRFIAAGIGVQLLIEFTNSSSESLHFIGLEGLCVLAQGPLNEQDTIAKANGIHPVVRLLRADKEHIVLSAIRTIRYLCVSPGLVPNNKNQESISRSQGVKLIVALMVHSRDGLIQVESALALSYLALGNQKIMDEIKQCEDFDFVRILKMLYSDNEMVRLLAASALSTFAFNNATQQRELISLGGITFSCFIPFLRSDDEFFRCTAAFQIVVLSKVIPDEEQAISSAIGVKLLVDLLEQSQSEHILALTADYIAALAHTRAGIPAAITSIHAITYLCKLLEMDVQIVQGCAAIALGYLSYHHAAERQILNRCRINPALMKVIKHHTKDGSLSPSFIEAWKHYRKLGLPAISEGKTALVTFRQDDGAAFRETTTFSIEETPSLSPRRSLKSSQSTSQQDEERKGSVSSRRSSIESRKSVNNSDTDSFSIGHGIESRTSLVPEIS